MGASPGINEGSFPKYRVAGQKCKVELEVQSAQRTSNVESEKREVEMESGELEIGNYILYQEVNLAQNDFASERSNMEMPKCENRTRLIILYSENVVHTTGEAVQRIPITKTMAMASVQRF